jgi:nucleotide-binding universal stress UspA family protein
MKVLLAIDDSKFSDAVIQAVISQRLRDSTQAMVLHALDWSDLMPSPFPAAGVQPMYAPGQLDALIKTATIQAHELVKSAAHRLRAAGFDVTASVREGDAKTVILDCAAEWGADLIIVGSHGRKGVTRFLLGSVSEAVARHAHCSVEIARFPAASD